MVLLHLLELGLLVLPAIATPVNDGYCKTKTKTVVKTATVTTSASPTSIQSTSSSAAASNTNPSTTLIATATGTTTGLHKAAKATGKLYFGTAADIPGTGELDDPYYMKQFNNSLDFGQATPANVMKYDATEPQQGVFDFTSAEQFLQVAAGTGKLVRCHTLIWHNQLPSWLTSPTTPWTNATLSAVLVNHVQTLIKHFGDRCYAWDVVNEAFSDTPAGSYGANVWSDTIGPEYVPMAFAAAQAAVEQNNLKVKLYYNDYNLEYAGDKSTAAQNLVKQLKARNIQIDGVGLQAHFIAGSTPSQSSQVANMNAFTALGVDVALTELDVRLTLPPSATQQAQQVADYYASVAACVAVARCVGVTVWDFLDTYSWVPGTFAGQGYADLFFQPGGQNTPLVKKAAYDGALEALTGKAEGI